MSFKVGEIVRIIKDQRKAKIQRIDNDGFVQVKTIEVSSVVCRLKDSELEKIDE